MKMDNLKNNKDVDILAMKKCSISIFDITMIIKLQFTEVVNIERTSEETRW